MRTIMPTAIALATALALAGCGSDDAQTSDTKSAEQQDTAQADAANPFADAEMKMNNDMLAAVGTDAGDSWVRKMIVHHQGAIDMSKVMLQQNPSEQVRMMAQQTIDKQTAEIADLEKLRKNGPPNQQSGDLYRQSMMDMQKAMMAATGANVEETFMRKMLAHHEGGVTMSEVALNSGVSGAVRSQATKTRDGQKKDAEMTRAMLNGEPMPAETRASSSSPGAPETPRASPSPRSSASPQAAAATAARPAPRPSPSASHDMSNMSNMKQD